ncbi:protein yellow-like [Bradysia coprophila]|uniref:protein yellow-like n=1 Tax=Bradysia coprophila TaxID=38358 RepID=UPI00187D9B2E|nr:protein yellow-like [Bradysia coprophila]
MAKLLIFALSSLSAVVHCLTHYDVYYKWKRIEYELPDNIRLNSSEYVPENNIVSVIKIYENRMWITTPRYFRGVPVTLNVIPYNHRYHWWHPFLLLHNDSPKLKPFPSYDMNKMGDCNALQLVSALDVDHYGRLWVVDVGRVNVLEPYKMSGSALNLCPAKLLVFDVTGGRSDLIFTYTFPDNVAPNTTTILKEMQVACSTEDDCWAFIPDFALNRLVVYDHKHRESWTAQHPSMAPDPNKVVFLVNGMSSPFEF